MPYPLKSAPLRRADREESSHPNRHAGTNFLLWRRSPATALSSRPSFPDGETGPCPSRCGTPILPQLGTAGPHNRPPRLGKRSRCSYPFFLLPQNAALDTARMDHHAEAFLNPFGQCRPTERWFCRPLLVDKVQYFQGELVRPTGPPLLWNQTCQTTLLEVHLRLIKRRPGHAKGRGRAAHGVLVDFDSAQHLVLDLDEILGIEEVAVLEQGVGYLFRMRRSEEHTSELQSL